MLSPGGSSRGRPGGGCPGRPWPPAVGRSGRGTSGSRRGPAATRSSPVSRSWTVRRQPTRGWPPGSGSTSKACEPEALAPVPRGADPDPQRRPLGRAEDEVRRRLQAQQSPGHLLPGQGLAQLARASGRRTLGRRPRPAPRRAPARRRASPASASRSAPGARPGSRSAGTWREGVVAHGLVERLVLGRGDLGVPVGDAGVGGRRAGGRRATDGEALCRIDDRYLQLTR